MKTSYILIFITVFAIIVLYMLWEMKRAIIEDDTDTEYTEKQEKH